MYEPNPENHRPMVENHTFHSDGFQMSALDVFAREEADVQPTHSLDSDTKSNLHRRLLSYYTQEIYIQAEQRRQMQRDEAYYDGDQWDAKDRAVLEARGQMPLVYNVIASSINWLLGTQRRGRAQFKVLARKKDGAKPAERKTQLLKYISDANREEYHMSRAFADAVKVGIGWLECGHDAESNREQIYSRFETWRNMIWDSRSIELDLADARYVFRAKWSDIDTAKAMFPDRIAALEQSKFRNMDLTGGIMDGWSDTPMDEAELNANWSLDGGVEVNSYTRERVRLIECWYKTPERTRFIKGGEFNGDVFDPFSHGHIDQLNNDPNVSIVNRTRMRVRVAIFTNAGLLYEGMSPYNHNEYPFTPIWGNRRGSDGMPYGAIRSMIDAQNDINKRASKALHILNSSKVIMDDGAVDDLDELADEVARPDALIVKKKGHELRIDQDRNLASAHMDIMSRDIDMIQQQSGITDEAMGRTTNATSGKAIVARQNQGSVAVTHFLDNLRMARQIHGEKELSLTEQYFSEEKMFRITNSRGTPEYITVNDGLPENDIVRTKADYLISDDDWQTTMRQAGLEELMKTLREVAPASPEVVMILLDLVVDAMDIPSKDEIVNRIRAITGAKDPDAEEDPNDPAVIAAEQAKQAETAMKQRAAEAEVSGLEATAAAKLGAEVEKTTNATTTERLQQIEAALRAATQMLAERGAAPLADELMARATQPQQPPAAMQPQAAPMPQGA